MIQPNGKHTLLSQLFQNSLLALKRDNIFLKKQSHISILCVCYICFFFTFCTVTQRKRENLVELQICLQIKSKSTSAVKTCKKTDYSTIGILSELYYTDSNRSVQIIYKIGYHYKNTYIKLDFPPSQLV